MMIAVVNFTNGKKNVTIETILHWHISQTSSLYKKEEKKERTEKRRKEKYTPYLFLKASVFPQNCYFLEIRGRYDSRGFLVFILCIG